MSRALSLALVLAATASALAADETYTLKLYKEKEGDVLKKSVKGTIDGKQTATIGGKTESTPVHEGMEIVETVEVMKWPADAKSATKRKRAIEKSVHTFAADKTVSSVLEGKTFVTEVTDGKETHTVDGKPATAEQAALLDGAYAFGGNKATSSSAECLPTKPVKVGDMWEVDVKKLLEADGAKGTSFDVKRSSVTGKLLKVEKKDGALWGSLELDMRFVMNPFPVGDKNTQGEAEGEMTCKQVVCACLDGTVPGESAEGTVGLTMTTKLPMDGKVVLVVTGTVKTTTEPVAKK